MTNVIQDAKPAHWVYRLPQPARSFAQLSRLDRPIGYWLLALPGWIGLAFASLSHGHGPNLADLKWATLIFIGAIAMRGAGCTFNDIVDQDLDAKVERTALRPLPAGTISTSKAYAWVAAQCLIGLIVLICLPVPAQIISLLAIPLVVAYPFMKRITWWPQIWLGLTFNWAVLVAYACSINSHWELNIWESLYMFSGASSLSSEDVFRSFTSVPTLLLYAGLVFWTVGYDTIYATQDIEDDAFVGIKSSARRMGKRIKFGVGICYFLAFFLVAVATVKAFDTSRAFHIHYHMFPDPLPFSMWILVLLFLTPFALHLIWQVVLFKPDTPSRNLRLFKSNLWAGLILFTGLHMISPILIQSVEKNSEKHYLTTP